MIVGVPLISPVDGFRFIPLGRAGVIDQEITVPPSYDGKKEPIEESLVSVNEL